MLQQLRKKLEERQKPRNVDGLANHKMRTQLRNTDFVSRINGGGSWKRLCADCLASFHNLGCLEKGWYFNRAAGLNRENQNQRNVYEDFSRQVYMEEEGKKAYGKLLYCVLWRWNLKRRLIFLRGAMFVGNFMHIYKDNCEVKLLGLISDFQMRWKM